MTPALTVEELLSWSQESSKFWKNHLEANPALLELPCGIAGTTTVQDLVRHIWGAELRWSGRLAALPVTEWTKMPIGPVDALFGMHLEAIETVRGLLNDPAYNWNDTVTLEFPGMPKATLSRRKIVGHMALHGPRHWAQLATLVRAAGFPSQFRGDLLFSQVLP